MESKKEFKIAIIGMGYVGLPLFVEFSKNFKVFGYDINNKRIEQLHKLRDITGEYDKSSLKSCFDRGAVVTSIKEDIEEANTYIVTVPTPVDLNNVPDLTYLKSASSLIGNQIKKGDLVIFESTVYPGVTEDECIKIIEEKSNLRRSLDFHFGYSPERINPGDKQTKISEIKKLVSGCCEESLKVISELYKTIIRAGVYECSSIKIAEAAKVIENVQRDVNIALVNEFSKMFDRFDINTLEVIAAASTKWNFIKFTPGFVGGHCIGVDPYYLIHESENQGYAPNLIKTAREINQSMPFHVFDIIEKEIEELGITNKKINFLVLGYTFKENCPDTRNSGVKVLCDKIVKKYGSVEIFDPYLIDMDDNNEGVKFLRELPEKSYDVIIMAVPHKKIKSTDVEKLIELMPEKKYIYDIRSFLPKELTNGRL